MVGCWDEDAVGVDLAEEAGEKLIGLNEGRVEPISLMLNVHVEDYQEDDCCINRESCVDPFK